MRTLHSTLLIILISFLSSKADIIKISADPWMPYTGVADSEHEGYIIEVAREALALEGHSLEYLNDTWVRSIANAKRQLIHGIAGAAKQEVPEFIFGQEHFGMTINIFYTTKDSKWTFKDMKSLEEQTLGVIHSYSYGDNMDKYIDEHQFSSNRIQFTTILYLY